MFYFSNDGEGRRFIFEGSNPLLGMMSSASPFSRVSYFLKLVLHLFIYFSYLNKYLIRDKERQLHQIIIKVGMVVHLVFFIKYKTQLKFTLEIFFK